MSFWGHSKEEKNLERPIKYKKRFNQGIVFDRLQDGLISPTDIDFCFEVNNEFLLIGDCKVEGAPFPIGQKLVLERIVDSWQKLNRKSIAMICTHKVTPPDPIVLADTIIEKVYFNGQWQDKNIIFYDGLKKLAHGWDIEKLKYLE